MNTEPNHDLTHALTREAEQFGRRGGSELEIGQVLARAGEIRRGRRMRATMLMAACVLAIAVPTVLVAVNRDATHEPSPAPAPKVDTSPLTLDGLKTGHDPRTGWFEGEVWHRPGGSEYSFSQARVIGAATVGDALLVATADDQGNQRASLVPPVSDTAQQVTSWPMEGGFAVSASGAVAAFVEPDGTPMVVQDGGGATDTMPKIPRGTGFGAVAVAGENCNESATDGGCTVWANSSGRKPEAWVSTSHGFVDRTSTTLLEVADAVPGHRLAGYTSFSDQGSCSAVEDTEGSQQWSTCDYRLLSFSPDGRHLLASGAYADGPGDGQVSILDSDTGRPVLDLQIAGQDVVTQTIWEDDRHVLAIVGGADRWAILRIGLDGSREYAVAPTATKLAYESPFVLPSR